MKISLIDKNANNNAALSRKVIAEVEFKPELVCEFPWSPMLVSDSYLKGSNFLSTQLLVFDIDNKPNDTYLSLNEAIERFKVYDVVIATTRSHQVSKDSLPPVDKYRVIFRLDKAITNPEQYKQNYVYYSNTLFNSGTVDEAVKDLARFYYSCKEVKHVSNGIVIKIRDLQIENKVAPLSISSTSNSSTDKKRLTRLSESILAKLTPITEWHQQTLKLMTDMKDKGWSEEETRDRVAELGTSDWDQNDDKRLKSVFKNKEVYFKDYAPMPIEDYIKRTSDGIIVSAINNTAEVIVINTSHKNRVKYNLNSILMVLNKYDRNEYISKINYCEPIYNPSMNQLIYEEGNRKFYNVYEPPHWCSDEFYGKEQLFENRPVPELVHRFLNHLVDGDILSYNYILDWCSIAIKDRNLTILTLIGNQGIGKGTLTDLLSMVFGKTNFGKGRGNIFKGRFNSQLGDKRLVLLDEVELKSDEEFNLFKDLVNSEIIIEAKGKDERLAKNFANFILISNDASGIRLPSDDRRFSLVNLTKNKLPTVFSEEEIIELNTNQEMANDFAMFLLHRQTVATKHTPFKAILKHAEIIQETRKNWEDFLINEFAEDNKGRRIPFKEVQDTIKMELGLRQSIGRLKMQQFCKENSLYFKFLRNDKWYLEVIGAPKYLNETLN